MSDLSLASAVEEWIAGTLGIRAEFQSANGGKAEVYPGSTAPDGARLIAELVGNRSTYACCLFMSDQELPLEGGESGWDATYLVLIACRNLRPGVARFGEQDFPIEGGILFKGVNYYRDVLRTTLHNQHPGIPAGGFFADSIRLAGVRVVYEQKDAYILEATLIVREVPYAG